MRRGGWEVRRVSVHRRLLGGRAFRLAEQGVGGGTAVVPVVGGGGGRRWTHLGLKHGDEKKRGRTIK